MSVYTRLRTAREKAGLTQKAVAVALNCDQPAISDTELGRHDISYSRLTRLANLYGVRMSWLCEDEVQS